MTATQARLDVEAPKAAGPGSALTEADLTTLLRDRYSGDEWAFIAQVPDSTGGARRTADGLAMNLWRSRGLALHGFEIKVSRRDWLKEKNAPEKADLIARFCHYWWIVTPYDPDGKMVPDFELPHGWGLIRATKAGTGLKVQTKAAARDDVDQVTPAFLAALLRRATGQSASTQELAAARQAGRTEAADAALAQARREAGHLPQRLQEVATEVEEFVKAAGFNPTHHRLPDVWDALQASMAYAGPEEVGRAVAALVKAPRAHVRALDELRRLQAAVARQIEDLESLATPEEPET